MRLIAIVAAVMTALGSMFADPIGHAAENQKIHRLAVQVDVSDPAIMNLALNNAENAIEYYKGKGEEVQVEIVTYGPGLHMLRADTSPVKHRIRQMKQRSVAFSACDNTKTAMEKREGKAVGSFPRRQSFRPASSG